MRALIFAVIVVSAGLVSCKKRQVNSIQDNMIQGTWRISSYVNNGVVETDSYYGDTFVFSEGGSFKVSGTHSADGTWFVNKETGDDDDRRTHLEFVMTVRGEMDANLSEDWHVEGFSNKELILRDMSGDGGIDYLTFSKN